MTSKDKAGIKFALKKKYLQAKLTLAEYNDLVAKLDEYAANGDTPKEAKEKLGFKVKSGATKAPAGPPMTKKEYNSLYTQLAQKWFDGEMTDAEHHKLDKILADYLSSGKTYEETKKAVGYDPATGSFGVFSFATQDPGQHAADKAVDELEKRLKKTYKQAADEITEKMHDFSNKFAEKDQKMQAKLAAGEITQAEYDHWLQGQVFIGDLWAKKMEQASDVLLNANTEAAAIIDGLKMGVFAENANYQSWELTQDTKMNLSFAVYDADAIVKLIKDRPELMPRKVVNGKKDKAWNKTKIANLVAQGIIQGEGIPAITKRIATETASSNMKAMIRYARTAMTSAQNAGRMETLQRAKGMGIQCKKVWLATLDSRTRDSHRNLDGKAVDIDKPFKSDYGDIMFPGDPQAHQGDVWNCRCTMTYEYEGYPADPSTNQRLMYEEWDEEVPIKKKDKNGKEYETKKIIHHRESKLVEDMTYNEWKAAKQGSVLNDLNMAKSTLAVAQKEIIQKKVDETKVYSDLWKDDVTLADYQDKKNGIQSKRSYYENEITKLEDAISNGASWAKPEKLEELKEKLKLLNEFEANGALLEKRNNALKVVQDLYDKVGYQQTATVPAVMGEPGQAKKKAGNGQFAPDAWDDATKRAAPFYDTKYDADKVLRPHLDAIWDTLTDEEKYAVWEYTANSNPMNKRLSGYGDTRRWERTDFVGYENAIWGLEDSWRPLPSYWAKFGENGHSLFKKAITLLTKAVEKSRLQQDIWFKRQSGDTGLAGMLEGAGMDFDQAMQLIATNPQALAGLRAKNHAFTSCGMAKDAQWPGNVYYKIYCPKGTKGIYSEPQSNYGHTSPSRMYEKGMSYTTIGTEAEVVLQRGTEFRITGVKRMGGDNLMVEMEVVAQPDYFTYGDEDTFNDGKTRHKR